MCVTESDREGEGGCVCKRASEAVLAFILRCGRTVGDEEGVSGPT